MRGRRLALAVTVALAIVVGSATTVLIAARSQQEKSPEPSVLFQEVPLEKDAVAKDSGDSLDLSGVSITGSGNPSENEAGIEAGAEAWTGARPVDGGATKPTPKPTQVITPQAGKSMPQESSPEGASRRRSAEPQGAGSSQGTVQTWHDGDRLMLQNDLAAQETSAYTADDDVVVKKGQNSIVRNRSGESSSGQPVFKPESGEGLMTLS